jgi:hypothetical protein
MINKWIKHVRAKPDSVKRNYTLAISLSVTGVIVFFWFISYLDYSQKILNSKTDTGSADLMTQIDSQLNKNYATAKDAFDFAKRFGGDTSDTSNVDNSNVDVASDVDTGSTTGTTTDITSDSSDLGAVNVDATDTNTASDNTITNNAADNTADTISASSASPTGFSVDESKSNTANDTKSSNSTSLEDILNTKK